MKLQIAKLTPAWKIVLDQIGIPYFESEYINENSKLFIVNSNIKCWEITDKPLLITPSVAGKKYSYTTQKVRYLTFEDDFSDLNPLDINTLVYKFRTNKKYKLHLQKIDNRWLLPFEIDEVVLNCCKTRKKFYAKTQEYPSEIVSQNSKGNLRRFIQKIIIKIFQNNQELFFAKSCFPQPQKNLFMFRVDTDFADIDDSQKLLELLEKYNIKASWFVETDTDKLISFYKKLSKMGHEVGLHCYRHRVFKSFKKNYNNLQQGRDILQKCGINISGFVSPYGDWNINLAKAMEKLGFSYSSEFALDYDNLPFYPYYQDKFSQVLQIPIHPISIGRLRRSHFEEQEILEYFDQILQQKIAWQEPLIIYHHPAHKQWNILESIFKQVNDWHNVVFAEYAMWWKDRLNYNFTSQLKSSNFPIYFKKDDKYSYGYEFGSEKRWQEARRPLTIPFSKKLRKWHWRDSLYNFESWRGKVKR